MRKRDFPRKSRLPANEAAPPLNLRARRVSSYQAGIQPLRPKKGEEPMRGSAREFDRVNATIPVQFEGGIEGETRNLSPSGVFFVVDTEMKAGGSLHFTLEFDSAAGKLYMDCIGEIVRVEKADGKAGIAG